MAATALGMISVKDKKKNERGNYKIEIIRLLMRLSYNSIDLVNIHYLKQYILTKLV